MRNLDDVIDQLILLVPTWEVECLKNFRWLKQHIAYLPPERMCEGWGLGEQILRRAILVPALPWHFEVLSLWMVKPVDELREMFKPK